MQVRVVRSRTEFISSENKEDIGGCIIEEIIQPHILKWHCYLK